MTRKITAFACTLIFVSAVSAQTTTDFAVLAGLNSRTVPEPPTSSVLIAPETHTGEIMIPAEQFWASAEYLLWWVRGDKLPALVTSGNLSTPIGDIGVLGVTGTRIVFGNERINKDPRSGVRLSIGAWLDECQTCGIGAEAFGLENLNDGVRVASPGTPPLARPVFNTLTGFQDAQLAAFPGVAQAALGVTSDSRMWGAGVFVRKAFCQPCDGASIEGLLGYRYLNLQEDVSLSEQLQSIDPTPGAPPIGTLFTLSDSYRTLNEFHGADIGLNAHFSHGQFFVDLLGKIAVGCNSRKFTVGGWSQTAAPGAATTTDAGGLYTLGLNGRTSDQVFAVVPELRLNVGCQVTDCARIFVGYTAMWWNNLARPGEQINLAVNPAELPPPLTPVVPRPITIRDSTLWLQGLNVGVAINF